MIKWAAGQCLVLRPCLGLSLEWPLSVWQNLSKNYKLAFLLKVANILQQFIIGVKFFQVDSQTSIFNVWLLLIRWAGRTCLYCGLYNSTASLLLSSPLPSSSWERELSWLPPLISPAAPLFLPSNGILYSVSSSDRAWEFRGEGCWVWVRSDLYYWE